LDSNLTEGETYNIDYEAETVGEDFGDAHNSLKWQLADSEPPSNITE